MICIGMCAQDRIQCDICRVAAVMIDDSEVFVLDFFYNALAVIAGEFNSQRRRQQTCKRLCDNHAVCADCLVCLDVLNDKLGGLFQHNMCHVRLIVAVNQRRCYVHQTASQRERADNACKYRTIGNQIHCLLNGINVNLRAACTDFRYLQSLCRFHTLVFINFRVENRTNYRRNLVVSDANRRTEALGLNRQIHQGYCAAGIRRAVGNSLHALCL